jgi:predicted enzyme related to lactoylglutathione lyase
MMHHPFKTFCFAEIHTTEIERSSAFYGELFGWTPVPVPAPSAAGGSAPGDPSYFMFQLDGQDVIAMRRTSGPHALLGYVNVASVDAVVAQAQGLGGGVKTPPFDTPGVARTAVLADREGALFGLWEGRGHAGAAVQDLVGTMWWIELLSLDIDTARDFYTSLFGWSVALTKKYADPGEPGAGYTVFKVGETSVGGAFEAARDWGIGPRWSVVFAIADWDETVRRVVKHGGQVVFWRDVPNAGRLGVINDFAGAPFLVMKPL